MHILARHAECALHVARQCVAAAPQLRSIAFGSTATDVSACVDLRLALGACAHAWYCAGGVLVCLCMAAVDCVQAL